MGANSDETDPDLESRAQQKLAHEKEHLEALRRMAKMAPYYEWVRDVFQPWLGPRVLDAGCGVGNFIECVADRSEFVLGVDLSQENLAMLQERFASYDNVKSARIDLDAGVEELRSKAFDTVVCLDVLEHIEQDQNLLNSLAKIVRPGGHVLIKVPACPWLFGSIDVASDHYRRYTRTMLRQRALTAGLEVQKVKYMNLAGVLPYFIKSRILKSSATFSNSFSPRQLAFIRRAIPVLRMLDKITGPPVGQSLVLAARRSE